MNRLCQSRGLQTAGILAVASFLLLLRSSHHWAQVLLLVATSCSGTAMSHLLFNSSESCRPCPAVRYGVSPSAFPSLPLLKETFTHTCCQGGGSGRQSVSIRCNCLCLGFFKLAMSFSSFICCSELSTLPHCSPSSSHPLCSSSSLCSVM